MVGSAFPLSTVQKYSDLYFIQKHSVDRKNNRAIFCTIVRNTVRNVHPSKLDDLANESKCIILYINMNTYAKIVVACRNRAI